MWKEAFLIGDSNIEGPDQVLSRTLHFNKHEPFEVRNNDALEEARRIAINGNYHNVRIVICYLKANPNWTITQARKRVIKPFKLF